jgi:hypothetical protein
MIPTAHQKFVLDNPVIFAYLTSFFITVLSIYGQSEVAYSFIMRNEEQSRKMGERDILPTATGRKYV